MSQYPHVSDESIQREVYSVQTETDGKDKSNKKVTAIIKLYCRVTIEDYPLRRLIQGYVKINQHYKEHCLKFIQSLEEDARESRLGGISEYVKRHQSHLMYECRKAWEDSPITNKWKRHISRGKLHELTKHYFKYWNRIRYSTGEYPYFKDHRVPVRRTTNPDVITAIQRDYFIVDNRWRVNLKSFTDLPKIDNISSIGLSYYYGHYFAEITYRFVLPNPIEGGSLMHAIRIAPNLENHFDIKVKFTKEDQAVSLIGGLPYSHYPTRWMEKFNKAYNELLYHLRLDYLKDLRLETFIRNFYKIPDKINARSLDAYCKLISTCSLIQIECIEIRNEVIAKNPIDVYVAWMPNRHHSTSVKIGWKTVVGALFTHLPERKNQIYLPK